MVLNVFQKTYVLKQTFSETHSKHHGNPMDLKPKMSLGVVVSAWFSKGYDFKITNAGIEGQSTVGHIYNFRHWFPKLKDF